MKDLLFRTGLIGVLLGILAVGLPTIHAEKKDPFAKVDKPKVEAAIGKGLEVLLANIRENRPLMPSLSPPNQKELTAEELVLYTLIKGGADLKGPDFNKLLDKVLAKKLERTYPVCLLAMSLTELDGKKYQARIAECGQFLLDNQCVNGQWSYGQPVEPLNVKITPNDSSNEGTSAVRMVTLRQRKKGPAIGDNSNTQYACLGLRACMQSSVAIPLEVFALTQQWLEKNQQKDGSWGYGSRDGNQISPGYGSMTVGALGSLIICKFYQTKRIPANDAAVQSGLNWLIKNFTVTENPKFEQKYWHYYYLYAIERLGAFLETEEFGKNEWYPTGAEFLLAQQQPDGSWESKVDATCFAILFLRRATKPLRAIISK